MNWQCLFGHADWHRGRDAEGNQVKLCDRCQRKVGVFLAGEVKVGPQAVAATVAGEPTNKAKRVVKDNVAPWKVGQR